MTRPSKTRAPDQPSRSTARGQHRPHRPIERAAQAAPARPRSALSPERLEELREALVAQRDFRVEQLAQLDRQRGRAALSGAHREVFVSLAVGARTALHEVQSALWRIEEGHFGECVSCGEKLDIERLETVPQTARCLACQQAARGADER